MIFLIYLPLFMFWIFLIHKYPPSYFIFYLYFCYILHIWTDGSCLKIDGTPQAGAGVVFECTSLDNISYKLVDNPSNNRAELTALWLACKAVLSSDVSYHSIVFHIESLCFNGCYRMVAHMVSP